MSTNVNKKEVSSADLYPDLAKKYVNDKPTQDNLAKLQPLKEKDVIQLLAQMKKELLLTSRSPLLDAAYLTASNYAASQKIPFKAYHASSYILNSTGCKTQLSAFDAWDLIILLPEFLVSDTIAKGYDQYMPYFFANYVPSEKTSDDLMKGLQNIDTNLDLTRLKFYELGMGGAEAEKAAVAKVTAEAEKTARAAAAKIDADAKAAAKKTLDDANASSKKTLDDAKAAAQKVQDEAKASAKKTVDDANASSKKTLDDTKAAAAKIDTDAKAAAKKTVDDANASAKKTVDDAKKEADRILNDAAKASGQKLSEAIEKAFASAQAGMNDLTGALEKAKNPALANQLNHLSAKLTETGNSLSSLAAAKNDPDLKKLAGEFPALLDMASAAIKVNGTGAPQGSRTSDKK